MPLFQNTVVVKYLKSQNKKDISSKWEVYKAHFLNPEIQENIRNSKEEQYQGEFLIDLFVKVLGYTKNPNPDFNLTTEYKNVKDSKKTDGAIIIKDVVKAVIELKGTNTTDLSKVETQAFGYKNNQPECTYVVTSNFEKLWFYIDNAIEHLEFNLFTLTQEEFSLLYLCLGYENIEKDIPKKIKEESISEEDAITKKLYKDYSLFRRELHLSLVELNPQYDALTLFKKTQKLLDRFLFLFFAEDRHLLPPNSVRLILEQWEKLKELDAYTPLFDRFKKYFGYLNTGFKGKKYNVYAYNGGLFKPDEILDNISIDDDLLYKHTLTLSEYDFDSEVDVNILGHIFENSLTEIEEIQSKLEGQEIEKTTSKRKKDGVFYTPKYITKYIVENTVGKLCKEKKEALQINDEDYITDKKRQKKTRKALLDKLTDYRTWLLQLTICDPACGSGAFLSQALSFLITEHSYIDELQAKLFGDTMILSDVENSILENNLFGVDINQESVEIAKLSLWLRTAQPNRKLNDLSNNIKCGNSLIDDPAVAGEKAFKWETEFPQIFKEKDKKIYHVTTAIHDSRTSKRMVTYKVRERRDMGTNPYPNVIYFTKEDDLLITQTIAQVVKENNIKLLTYNICADHIHLLLVCDIDEIPSIMKKIKGRSSFASSSSTRGLNPLLNPLQKTNKPLWQQKYSSPKEVTSEEQLQNTIDYIQNNRHKHELPPHSNQIKLCIENMCCDLDIALNPEYTGGFDVIIGNPPYVRKQGLLEHYPEMCEYYEKKYQSATANYDIYALFMERSFDLIHRNGIVSYILPHKFLVTDFGIGIRQFFKENSSVKNILHFGSEMVFADASTYTCIINLDKSEKDKIEFKKINPLEINNSFVWDYMLYKNLDEHNWDLQSQKVFDTIDKLKQQPYTIADVFKNVFVGMQTSLDAVYVFEGIDKGNYIEAYNPKYDYHFEIEKELVKPILGGKDIHKYQPNNKNKYVLFPYNNDGTAVDENHIKLTLPKTYKYLKQFEQEIRGREKGKMDIDEGWYLYIYQKNHEKFPYPKIMTREISLGCNMTYDEKGEFYHNTKVYSFIRNEEFKIDDKFYLGILNSKVMWFFIKNTGSEYRGGYFVFKTNYLKPFPLPEIPENANLIIDSTNQMLSLNKELQEVSGKYKRTLQRKFEIEKLSKKLEDWYTLSFTDFIKELKKKKIKLSLAEEAEWEDYFLKEQEKALDIKSKIDTTNAAIDQMVYELYGLTEEEIEIVQEA